MSGAAWHPHLKLVRGDECAPAPTPEAPWRDERAARTAVAMENRAARHNLGLNPLDPRWVVAVRAYSQLQGTTLTPERRRHVQQTARLMGVRPFETNVIIALGQDAARRKLPLAEAWGAVDAARPAPDVREPHRARWAIALAGGLLLGAMLIGWMLQHA
jgi:hypothetical protein